MLAGGGCDGCSAKQCHSWCESGGISSVIILVEYTGKLRNGKAICFSYLDETFHRNAMLHGHYKQEHKKVFENVLIEGLWYLRIPIGSCKKRNMSKCLPERAEKEFLTQNKYAAKNCTVKF